MREMKEQNCPASGFAIFVRSVQSTPSIVEYSTGIVGCLIRQKEYDSSVFFCANPAKLFICVHGTFLLFGRIKHSG